MIDSEMALLGALLHGFDPSEINLQGGEFYQLTHEWVYDAIRRVHDGGERVEPMKVRLALGDKQQKLPQGPLYLTTLMEACPVPASAPFYAKQVKAAAVRRRLAELGQRLTQAVDSDSDPEDLVNDAKQWLDEFDAPTTGQGVSLGDAMVEVIEVAQHGRRRGLSSPWPDIDHLTRGYYPGRLYVVGARPGVGKSLWASNTAVHVAKQGLGVLVASMEMSSLEWSQRCAAAEAKVNIGHLEDGNVSDDEWARISAALGPISELPIEIRDSESQTVPYIRACARAYARRHKLGMIVVDYLQLLLSVDRKLPRHEQVADMSRSLKRLARELDVPVLALAQVNRAATQRRDARPTMADLRESGAIEADADSVILLHTDDEQPHIVEATVAKGRSTAKGTVNLQMQGHYSRLVSDARSWSPSQSLGAPA